MTKRSHNHSDPGRTWFSAVTSSWVTQYLITPTTLVLFLVAAVTGVMLLLGVEGRFISSTHEWLGLVFVAIAVWHIFKNWANFRGYLQRPQSLTAIVGSIVVVVAFAVATSGRQASGRMEPEVSPGALFQALSKASLTAVAPAFSMNLDEASTMLREAGFRPAPEMRIGDIAEDAQQETEDVVRILLQGSTARRLE